MNPFKSLLGIFAVLGTWPDWESYFDLSRRGLKVSFVVLAISLLPFWLMALGLETERARYLETEVARPELVSFTATGILWLFSFPALSYLIGMIFEKMDRTRAWIITRNWTVSGLSLLVGIGFGLFLMDALSFKFALGIAFAAYIGLLGADIRLAQKVAGFSWGTAMLIACVIVAVSLTFVILSISR